LHQHYFVLFVGLMNYDSKTMTDLAKANVSDLKLVVVDGLLQTTVKQFNSTAQCALLTNT